MIALRLLGPVEARVGGAPPPRELLWRKHLALLAYLACAPDGKAGREELMGLLWGDRDPAAARHSLSEALRIVRQAAGGALGDAGPGYVRLDPGSVDLDTARLARHVDAGELTEAAALVRGEFMQGFALPDAWSFEDWLDGQRRAWRSRCEDALVGAALQAGDAGAHEDAERLARHALTLVPESDLACQAGMKSLCMRGDRARALALYDAFADRLRREIGIEPAAETERLAGRVRARRAWRAPPTREREPRGAESRRAPLVGRRDAMAALVREWEACRAGGGARAILIAGDPGTGRSRLLHEILERARLDGARAALVRALPSDRDDPGAVARALARRIREDATPEPEPAADATGSVAAVAALPALPTLLEADGASPLLLAVDDARWCDPDSLELLTDLPARAARHTGTASTDSADGAGSVSPILVAFTAPRSPRPEPLERLAARLGRDVPGTQLRLEPLDEPALRALAAWAFPDYHADALDRLARRLAADTGGLPLHAVELLHALAHGLALDDHPAWPDAGRTLDHTRPGSLPGTLSAAVRVGFRVLSRPAQAALAAAAVLEPPASSERIGRATGLDGEARERALDELEWERWLAADERGYTFVARVVRELVATEMITPGQRLRMLQRVDPAPEPVQGLNRPADPGSHDSSS